MTKIDETIELFLNDSIQEIIEDINDLKGDKSEFARGQRLAYIECLEKFKRWVAGDEEKFGLDGDLDKKFGLI